MDEPHNAENVRTPTANRARAPGSSTSMVVSASGSVGAQTSVSAFSVVQMPSPTLTGSKRTLDDSMILSDQSTQPDQKRSRDSSWVSLLPLDNGPLNSFTASQMPETPRPSERSQFTNVAEVTNMVQTPYKNTYEITQVKNRPGDLRSRVSETTTVLPHDSKSRAGQQMRQPTSLHSQGKSTKIPISSSSGVLGTKGYAYHTLKQSEFRLIKVFRQTMSTIKCQLGHYRLGEAPDYTAISYAWGDFHETENIILQGVTIPITTSLHGALRAVREKNKDVYVWADALCIDQSNRSEKTKQISLMTAIYAMAQSVVIWLGPEGEDSDKAVTLLEEVANKANSSDTDVIKNLISSRSKSPAFPALVSLFGRDYWQRLWVVQEVLNAKKVMVCCGYSKLPWDTYRDASIIFRHYKPELDRHFPSNSKQAGDQRVSQTKFSFSQVLAYHGPSSIPNVGSLLQNGDDPLLEVMRACRQKLATDPRDKVFGILGVLPVEIRNEFTVTYSMPVKDIYITVVDYLLNMTDRLDVICESIHFPTHASSNSLPTWVPDWSNTTTLSAMGRSFHFDAAKGEPQAKFRLLDKQRKLEISAIPLDAISEHGIRVGTLCTLADYLMAFLHWRAVLLDSRYIRNSSNAELAFCKTLCLGQVPSGTSEVQWQLATYTAFASLIRERLPRMQLDTELQSFTDSKDLPKSPERRRFLQQHFGNRMFGRCFCITKNGLMGMGSGFMAPGDLVVVPLGCRTPIILRPVGQNEFHYVGDVYIHGYMNGKAVEELRDKVTEVRKYILR